MKALDNNIAQTCKETFRGIVSGVRGIGAYERLEYVHVGTWTVRVQNSHWQATSHNPYEYEH